MPDPTAIGEFIDRYGFPLLLIVGAVGAAWRGVLFVQSGAQRKAELKQWADDAVFREQLRQEERTARLLAEGRLAAVVETVAPALIDLKLLLGEIEKEVIRGGRSRNHGS